MRVEIGVMAFALAIGVAGAGELTVESGGLTVQEAIDKIRAERAHGDKSKWTVKVKGFNAIDRQILITEADHDLDFVGEDGAVVSGGVKLGPWIDTGNGWWEAPAPRDEKGDIAYFEQLWVNGRRADRSRYPNEGYLKIVNPTEEAVSNQNGVVTGYVERFSFTNEAANVLASIAPEEMQYAQMGAIHKWSFARRILRGFDKTTGTVEFLSHVSKHGWQVWSERETIVFFENVRGAFDAPGEWFYDVVAGKVLYRPLPGETEKDLIAVAPAASISTLLRIRGDYAKNAYVSNIRFANVAFAHSAATAPKRDTMTGRKVPTVYRRGQTESWQHQAAVQSDGLIHATGVRNICFDRCRVEHTGNYAIRFGSGCMSNSVVNCEFNDLGAGGVWIGSENDCRGKGDGICRKVLAPNRPDSTAFNLVSNCLITAAGRFNPEATGVIIGHCSDSKVVCNDIHDIFYTGISCGWVWGFAGSVAQRNEIAYNLIYDLGKHWQSDMGGIYMLGTSYGTKVHHNVIHDVWSYSYGGWGLYCDEGSENIVMENNICWNTTDGGFHQHYGTGCYIRNNIFAFNRELGAVRMQRPVVDGVPCTLHFYNNIVYVNRGPLAGKGVRNVGGVWANNVWFDTNGIDKAVLDGSNWSDWVASRKETGSVFADPLFEDADAFDFRLKPNSPAFALGFRAWDYSKAGRR